MGPMTRGSDGPWWAALMVLLDIWSCSTASAGLSQDVIAGA